MTAKARCPHAEGGFTLLEMLVALAVLGLLLVGLTQGVRSGLALRQAQLKRLDQTAQLDATMRVLRTVLGRLPVTPLGRRLIPRADGSGFRGEAGSVSFVGNLPIGFGATERTDMTLFIRDDRLVLAWLPHRHEEALAARPESATAELLAGVKRLDLAYWGIASRGQPAAWQARWEKPEAPELIRVRLVFGKDDSRRWADLIVAPRP